MLGADLKILRTRELNYHGPLARTRAPFTAARRPNAPMANSNALLGESGYPQGVAESTRQLFKVEYFFRIRFFVNAVQRNNSAKLQIVRYGLIGRKRSCSTRRG